MKCILYINVIVRYCPAISLCGARLDVCMRENVRSPILYRHHIIGLITLMHKEKTRPEHTYTHKIHMDRNMNDRYCIALTR